MDRGRANGPGQARVSYWVTVPMLFFNFVAFQAGWFACVMGAGRDWPYLGPAVVLVLVLVHLTLTPRPTAELRLLILLAVMGTFLDSLLAASGFVTYRGGYGLNWLAPAWITALWVNFATTLHFALRWLADRLWLAGVFGALAGPLAYYAGSGLGAAELPRGGLSLLALAIVWGAAVPFSMALSKRPAFAQDPNPT